MNLAFLRVTVAMRNWFKKVSPTLNVILEAVTWQLTVVSASVTSHTHTGPLYTQGSSMTAIDSVEMTHYSYQWDLIEHVSIIRLSHTCDIVC